MRGNVDVPELVQYAAKKKREDLDMALFQAVAEQMQQAIPPLREMGSGGGEIDFVLRNDQ